MSAKWEKKGTNDGVLTFEIAEDKIKEGLDKAFNKVKGKLSVPGFRKGKVPRSIFNRTYGESALYEDALNILLPDAYDSAVEELELHPVAQPKINVVSLEKGQPWVIEATIVVKPEVTLGDYKGLTVEKQDREVTDEEVTAELEQKQASQAELVVKEDAAVLGDTVVIDFEGFKDGEPFAGGKAENHSLELGSNAFIPGFEDQLVGTKAGDSLDVSVTFPENYHAEDLKGQPVVFKVTVHEVKAKELPELDDEFAKDVDDTVETLAELKDKIRQQLTEKKEKQAAEVIEDLALRQAVANAEIVDLPHEMVHAEVHRQMDFFLNDMRRQGISPEMYYSMTGTTEADLHKQFEEDADVRTKTNLVLEQIVKEEQLVATDEDIEKEITELAATYNMEVDAVRKVLRRDMLENDIAMKKAMALITDSVVEK